MVTGTYTKGKKNSGTIVALFHQKRSVKGPDKRRRIQG
jgi:hypothetical protein